MDAELIAIKSEEIVNEKNKSPISSNCHKAERETSKIRPYRRVKEFFMFSNNITQ